MYLVCILQFSNSKIYDKVMLGILVCLGRKWVGGEGIGGEEIGGKN
jgi:hypothetical protein